MDDADITSQRAEYDHLHNLEVSKKKPGPRVTGYCLNCGPDTPLPEGHRWCDSNCRNDWEKYNAS